MLKGTDAISFLFSMLLFPELMNKSKEEMIGYANTMKESGKITDEEYQKTLEFINKIDELKDIIKQELKKDDVLRVENKG